MRLKTKLVLSITALMFAIVLMLSSLFVGELLRQRIEQTAATNDVLAHEVLLMTRQAVELGLRAHPPVDRTDEALKAAGDGCAADAAGAVGCDERDCALLADGAGCERDGCVWDDAAKYGSGCVESAGSVSDGVEYGGAWGLGFSDAGGVRTAAGAGYLAVVAEEWAAVFDCACGGAVDVFEELVCAVAASGDDLRAAGGVGFDGGAAGVMANSALRPIEQIGGAVGEPDDAGGGRAGDAAGSAGGKRCGGAGDEDAGSAGRADCGRRRQATRRCRRI